MSALDTFRRIDSLFLFNLYLSGRAVFRIADNFLLKRTEFYLDGHPAEAEEENGIWRLSVTSGEKVCQITVRAEDEAGNRSELMVKCSPGSL